MKEDELENWFVYKGRRGRGETLSCGDVETLPVLGKRIAREVNFTLRAIICICDSLGKRPTKQKRKFALIKTNTDTRKQPEWEACRANYNGRACMYHVFRM